MTTAKVELPPKLIPLFAKPGLRFRCSHGGRGSGKTRAFARMAAVRGVIEAEAGRSGVILCGREFQNSLDESSMAEIKAVIEDTPWLAAYYEIGERFIRTRNRRVEFKFIGLRHSLNSIKSTARILLAWVDEAETVSEAAWVKLIPTVREEGSELWVTWNPEDEESATNRRFRNATADDHMTVELNWRDNPWWPEVLEIERRRDLAKSPELYEHVWEGGFLTITDAQVFAGKFAVEQFETSPDWNGPYFGVDFGFAQDPTCATESWIAGRTLYVRREAGKVGLELDDTARFLGKTMPALAAHRSRADSARPESISYLKRHGMPLMEGVKKWQGSVEDGVEFIRSFDRVVIHPECPATAREFRLYAYRVDRLSGDIMPQIVDAHNHYLDSLRYALAPLIQRKGHTSRIAVHA